MQEIYLKVFAFYRSFFIKQSQNSVCFTDKKLEIESFLVTPFLLSISAKNSFEKTGNFETLSLFAPGRRVLFGSQKRPPLSKAVLEKHPQKLNFYPKLIRKHILCQHNFVQISSFTMLKVKKGWKKAGMLTTDVSYKRGALLQTRTDTNREDSLLK